MQLEWNETDLGFSWEDNNTFVFFGKKSATFAQLKQSYPQFEFYILHQVHGDQIVESAEQDVKADAHWTSLQGRALAIQTADCIPLFLHHPPSGLIGAAHAGWRGVASQIVSKLALQMAYKGAQFRELKAYVGPHIQIDSFEVDTETKKLILSAVPNMNDKEMIKNKIYQDLENGKSLVDLAKVVQAQLANVAIAETAIHWLKADTKTDDRFHSFRRDKDQAGRQISFIAQK